MTTTSEWVTAYVIFPDGARIRADVAASEEARTRGLMLRAPLTDAEGMLFEFEMPGRYGFWMKNVLAPLDIIWLDEHRRIVWLVENAPPCEEEPCPMYWPAEDASRVLEVAGGFAHHHGVTIGDVLTIADSG